MIITTDMAERLSKLPDLDTSNLSLPDCILRIKDLSDYPIDSKDAIFNDTFLVWYKDGTGEGITCAKEELHQWISAKFGDAYGKKLK